MNRCLRKNKKILVVSIGVFLGLNYTPVIATEFGPLNGGPINLNDGDVVKYNSSTNTTSIIGINSLTSSIVTINGSANINVNNGGDTKGVYLANGVINTLGSNSHIKTVGAGTSYGLHLMGSGTVANADNLHIDTTATTGTTFGMNVSAGGKVNLTGESSINVTGKGIGLFAQDNNTGIIADKLNISTANGTAVNVERGAQANLGTGSTIAAGGSSVFGIWARDNGAFIEAKEVAVKTTGLYSTGIKAQNGGRINIAEGSHVETASAFGISAESTLASSASTLNFFGTDDKHNTITVNAVSDVSNVSAAYAQGASAKVNLKNTDINATNASGLRADNSGRITGENTNINMSTVDKFAVYASNSGNITLTDKTTIAAGTHIGSALYAASGSNITVVGKTDIVGNLYTFGNNSKIELDTSPDSILTGSSMVGNGTNINLKMTGSTWNMTDNSQVNKLNLDNTAINFTNENYTTLKADSLEGNGLFNIRTDIISQQSDLIVINGIAQGTHKLNITNNGAASTDGTETLTVIQTGTNNANFTLNNKVELGAYEYGLRSSAANANNIELYSSGASTGGLTTTAQAAGSFLNIGYLTNYIESQTLLQRLGDLRNNQQGTVKQNGFWMKEFGGKLNSFSGTALDHFDMAYTGTQLGIDKQIDAQNGNLLIGAMAGYTRTNPNYREGNGDGKNYTAGLYATYLLDDGLYIDSVLKYNSMRNHFNVKDTAGNSVKGTGKTQGITLTAEIGKRYWLNSHNQGLYLEPQAQLTYGYQNGDTVHASNGLRVGLSHYNSTLGRVSGIIGYQIQGETPVNIYLKSGIVREMSGGANYRFNDGNKNNHSFRSSWFDNGLGINANINKKHNIYAEVDYATGNHFDNAKLDIGYRYSF